jgi:hypothetical protein
MPRSPDDVHQQRVVLQFDNPSEAADATVKIYKVPAGRKFRLDKARYINPTGLVQDAANYFNIKVLKTTTVMANWSTLTGQQGSIAADTFVDLVLSATDANRVAAGDEVISVFFDEGGDTTLPAGRLVLEGRLL